MLFLVLTHIVNRVRCFRVHGAFAITKQTHICGLRFNGAHLQTCSRWVVGFLLVLVMGVGAGAQAEQTFTVSVIGDQQRPVDRDFYVDWYTSFTAQTTWLAANAQSDNIRFVTQVGDIVEHGSDLDEWARAEAAMATLDSGTNADGGVGIPWSVAYGNHEVDTTEPGSDPAGARADRYRENFGSDGGNQAHRYAGQTGFGGASSNDLNTYHYIKSSNAANARTYLHLNLEYDVPGHEPGATPGAGDIPAFDAIAWAQSVIDANPGMPTMITTHVFEGTAHGPPNNPYTSGPGRNSQLQIFDKLIDDNSQIFLVNSGHTSQDSHQIKTNAAGFPVLQMSTDYNKVLPNGGDGFMRLIEIDEDSEELRIKTFAPAIPQNPTERYITDSDGQFTFSMAWDGRFPPTAPSQTDVILRVNRITGELLLENTSSATSDLDFRGYQFNSSLGALNATAANWKTIAGHYDLSGDQSVDDNDEWTIITNPLVDGVSSLAESESGGDGGMLAIGASVLLSQGAGAWIPSPNETDLSAQVTLEDGSVISVPVVYEGNGGVPLAFGDLDHDGDLNGDDWIIFAGNFPSTSSDLIGLSSAQAYALGDLTRNGVIDILDFNEFKQNYNLVNGEGAFGAMLQQAPEPSSFTLFALAAIGLLARRCGQSRTRSDSIAT